MPAAPLAAPNPERERRDGERVTWLSIVAELVLIALKLTVGLLGRSQALVADAAHSASDLVTDFVTLVGLRLGRAPRDREHPYGHGKFEDLAALVVGLALLGVAVLLAVDAVRSLAGDKTPERSLWLLAAAGVSILVKEFLARLTYRVARRLSSPTLAANAAHHRSDALSSVSAFLGLGLFLVHPEFHWADGMAALVVAAFIVRSGLRIIRETGRDLVDTAPSGDRVDEIRRFVEGVDGVRALRRLRGRHYAQRLALDLDIEVDPGLTVREGHDIAERLSARIRAEFPSVYEVMVHTEPHLPGGPPHS